MSEPFGQCPANIQSTDAPNFFEALFEPACAPPNTFLGKFITSYNLLIIVTPVNADISNFVIAPLQNPNPAIQSVTFNFNHSTNTFVGPPTFLGAYATVATLEPSKLVIQLLNPTNLTPVEAYYTFEGTNERPGISILLEGNVDFNVTSNDNVSNGPGSVNVTAIYNFDVTLNGSGSGNDASINNLPQILINRLRAGAQNLTELDFSIIDIMRYSCGSSIICNRRVY